MEQDNLFSPNNLAPESTDHFVSSGAAMPNSIIQNAPIVDPALHYDLIQIINQLDPSSFVKLARTCRTMHHICFSAKGIEVQFGGRPESSPFLEDGSLMGLDIIVVKDDSKPDGVSIELLKDRFIGLEVNVFSEEVTEKILKMPCRVVINFMKFDLGQEASTRQLEALRRYLRRFRRLRIEFVSAEAGTSDWNTFAEIIQEFGVKQFSYTETVDFIHDIDNRIPEDVLFFFATNLTVFDYAYYVSDDIILATTAMFACFPEARISVDTFKKLLERFVAGEFYKWDIGRQPLMGNNDDSDPFVDACSEVMKVAQVENVNFITKDPGVLYCSPDYPWMFQLLSSDGSTGRLIITDDLISLFFY